MNKTQATIDTINTLAPHLANDVHEFFRTREKSTTAPADYMEGQDDINEHMRAVLVDWLVEVHMGFKLVPETLYLAVNIMDRYLAKAIISRKRLQLVGVTALMIAAKYEEDDPPCIKNFVYICDDTYTKPEVSISTFIINNIVHVLCASNTPFECDCYPYFRRLAWNTASL